MENGANLFLLSDYIQTRPNEAFKDNSQQRKNALRNKLEEVFAKIENREYQDAVNKLQNDIRTKADGDPTAEDWIISPTAQEQICDIIDELISYFKDLL